MVGSENDLTKFLVTTLMVGRLVTVRFPTCSNVAFRQSDNPHRILKVKSIIGEAIELF
jgi:hypothetical protein